MNREEYEKVSAYLERVSKNIQNAKRPAYTIGNADVLHNFKSVAQRVGITPGQALAVYMLKHVDAVISALAKPEIPQAEEITGRFADLINYAHLGYSIVAEEQGIEIPTQAPVVLFGPDYASQGNQKAS